MEIKYIKATPAIVRVVVDVPAKEERFQLEITRKELEVLRFLTGNVSGTSVLRPITTELYSTISDIIPGYGIKLGDKWYYGASSFEVKEGPSQTESEPKPERKRCG